MPHGGHPKAKALDCLPSPFTQICEAMSSDHKRDSTAPLTGQHVDPEKAEDKGWTIMKRRKEVDKPTSAPTYSTWPPYNFDQQYLHLLHILWTF